MKPLTYNGQIVPWTTPWTAEMTDHVVKREHIVQGALAICQRIAPGEGKPLFGTQHLQRQRQAIIQGRCDVCGGVIRPGQHRVLLHPGTPLKGTNEVGHTMAPAHRECARQAALVCPWIIQKIEGGSLTVIVAKKTRILLATLDPEIVEAETGQLYELPVVGHAKLIVDKSVKRDAQWLLRELG